MALTFSLHVNRIGIYARLAPALLAAGIIAATFPPADAAVLMPAFFCDGMVIQRGVEFKIFGDAPADEKVTVEFKGEKHTVRADFKTGKWEVKFAPLKADSTPAVLTIQDSNSLVKIKNVLVGDVWFYVGSEYDWTRLERFPWNNSIIFKGARSNVARVFTFKLKVSKTPLTPVFLAGQWKSCASDDAKKMPGMAYIIAKSLSNDLGIPIGIIAPPSPDVPLSSWLDKSTLKTSRAGQSAVFAWKRLMASSATAKAAWGKKVAKWKEERKKALASGRRFTKKPPPEPPGKSSPMAPSALYNSALYPFKGINVKGVIWEAGQAGAANPAIFKALLPVLLSRVKRFLKNDGAIPLVLVGTGDDGATQARAVEYTHRLPYLREVERLLAKRAGNKVVYVPSSTLGWSNNRPMFDLARRILAGIKLAAYGGPPTPVLHGVKINEDGNPVVSCDNVAGSLEGHETFVLKGDKSNLVGKNVRIHVGKSSPGVSLKETSLPGRRVVKVEVDLIDSHGNRLKRLKTVSDHTFEDPVWKFFLSLANLTDEEKLAREEEQRKAEEEQKKLEDEQNKREEELTRENNNEPPPPANLPPPSKPPKPPPPKGSPRSRVYVLNTRSARGFAMSAPKKKPLWALAKIKGSTVELSNIQIKQTAGVWYGWGDIPLASLFSKDWLPIPSFRATIPSANKKKKPGK